MIGQAVKTHLLYVYNYGDSVAFIAHLKTLICNLWVKSSFVVKP